MPKGINIDIAMNTRNVQSGAKNLEQAFEAVADSLDDVARDSVKSGSTIDKSFDKAGDSVEDMAKYGDRAGSSITKSMDKAARSVQDVETEAKSAGKALDKEIEGGAKSSAQAVDKLERSFKDMADSAKRESKKAGESIDTDIKRGAKDAGEGFRELKDEANSTAREAAASWSGSADDIASTAQEVLANALAGFGPIGAAAGLAAAVGFGALTTAIAADAEANEQRVSDMYDDMIESGNNYLSQTAIAEKISEIVKSTDDWNTAQKDAAVLGVDVATVLRAQAGDSEALAAVQGLVRDKLDAAAEAQRGATGAYDAQTQAAGAQFRELGPLAGRYDAVSGSLTQSAQKADAARSAMDASADSYTNAGRAADDAANRIRNIPNGKKIIFDADTSALDAAISRQNGRRIVVNVDGVVTRIGNQTI